MSPVANTRWILLLSRVLYFFYKIEGETIEAKYLRVIRRHSPSEQYDYFYSCISCGRGVQWEVNGESAATHTVTDNIGSVAYETVQNDSSALRYTSILIGKEVRGSDVCVNTILIATRTELHHLRVICRGTTQQVVIKYELPDSVELPDNHPSVKLNIIVEKEDVITLKPNVSTVILMCTSSETSQLWQKDSRSAGAFNNVDKAGSIYFEPLGDPSLLSRAAVFLTDHRNIELTSVLILSDFVPIRSKVSCFSDNFVASIRTGQLSTGPTNEPQSFMAITRFTQLMPLTSTTKSMISHTRRESRSAQAQSQPTFLFAWLISPFRCFDW